MSKIGEDREEDKQNTPNCFFRPFTRPISVAAEGHSLVLIPLQKIFGMNFANNAYM
jgi:hypothetical protein